MKKIAAIYLAALILSAISCMPTSMAYNKYDKDGFMQGWWLVKSDTSCIQIVKYKKGFKEGTAKKTFNNGQYATEHYKHGKLNGNEKLYSGNGQLIRTRLYKNDSLVKETILPESYIDWKKYRRM